MGKNVQLNLTICALTICTALIYGYCPTICAVVWPFAHFAPPNTDSNGEVLL